MTFDEWADSQDLDCAERRLCREYLAFVRQRKTMQELLDWIIAEEGK